MSINYENVRKHVKRDERNIKRATDIFANNAILLLRDEIFYVSLLLLDFTLFLI